MVTRSLPWLLRYGGSGVLVLLAWALVRVLGPETIGLEPLFFAAVVVSAWCCGLGPGLLATLLAGLATALLFVDPYNGRLVWFDDAVRAAVFVAVAFLINSLQEGNRRIQAHLRDAIASANSANQAKDQFLAVLSHELRNPLNPVLIMSSMRAQDASLPPEIRDDFRMIHRNMALESRLIDDLLDLNRIARGKMTIRHEPVEMPRLVQEVVEMCGKELGEKKLHITMRLTEGIAVEGDPARLRQVLWNLLKNAIKFTPAGGTIPVELDGADDEHVELRVKDTGIGIEPPTLGRVFHAFDQGGQTITRKFGGLGLGLAISKALVEGHGGTIAASSEGKNRGATFVVRLPRTHSPACNAEMLVQSSEVAGHSRPLRILLVEDHKDTAKLLSRVLRGDHHEVSIAGSIAEALAAAGSAQFDLLISDLGLPDGSGLDLMRQLHRAYGLKGIAVSGYGMEEDIRQSEEAGFAEHLTKPLKLDMLEATIRRLAS